MNLLTILATLFLLSGSSGFCDDGSSAANNFLDPMGGLIDSNTLGRGRPPSASRPSTDEVERARTDAIFDGSAHSSHRETPVSLSTPTLNGEVRSPAVADVLPYEDPAEGITTPIRSGEENNGSQEQEKRGWWKTWGMHVAGALLYAGGMAAGALYGTLAMKSVFWTLGLGAAGFFAAHMFYPLVVGWTYGKKDPKDPNDKRTGLERAAPEIGLSLGVAGGIALWALGLISGLGGLLAMGLGGLGGYIAGQSLAEASYHNSERYSEAQRAP